ncbi:hypothetical protein BY458DRAFT_501395 [Sporodiniella umbellata]|nr:hypothetical protein BY458DRAFT_501395 [Sporodiniella umbellata]
MPSEKFRIVTNGQSLRNPNNAFFDMTLSANLTLDESSDISAHNDRRSAHNALERQRRENLNYKFQQLAHALPSLQSIRRPSKATIVSKSLEFVSTSLKRETQFLSEIETLRQENAQLKLQAEQDRKLSSAELSSPPSTPKTVLVEPKKRARVASEWEGRQKKKMVRQERENKHTYYLPAQQDLFLFDSPAASLLVNPFMPHYYPTHFDPSYLS